MTEARTPVDRVLEVLTNEGWVVPDDTAYYRRVAALVVEAAREARATAPAGLREAAAKLAEVSTRLVSRLRAQPRIECVEMTMVEQDAAALRAALAATSSAAPESPLNWCDEEDHPAREHRHGTHAIFSRATSSAAPEGLRAAATVLSLIETADTGYGPITLARTGTLLEAVRDLRAALGR